MDKSKLIKRIIEMFEKNKDEEFGKNFLTRLLGVNEIRNSKHLKQLLINKDLDILLFLVQETEASFD